MIWVTVLMLWFSFYDSVSVLMLWLGFLYGYYYSSFYADGKVRINSCALIRVFIPMAWFGLLYWRYDSGFCAVAMTRVSVPSDATDLATVILLWFKFLHRCHDSGVYTHAIIDSCADGMNRFSTVVQWFGFLYWWCDSGFYTTGIIPVTVRLLWFKILH